jgi:hypothetical protein
MLRAFEAVRTGDEQAHVAAEGVPSNRCWETVR